MAPPLKIACNFVELHLSLSDFLRKESPKYIAGSSNGRTRDFGSRYSGSNPGPAAKVKKFLPYLLILIGFSFFIWFFHRDSLTYRMPSTLVHDYLRSQDIEDPKGLIHDRIFVSDSDIYIASGYLYAKGADPSSLNLHPPLMKYLFGFSTLLTGNPFWIQMIFGLVLLFLTYFLGTKLFKNKLVAFAGTLLLMADPVFGGMMNEALLDLGQTVFALSYFVLVFFFPETYIFQGIALGLAAASKFWSTAVIFVILTFGYKILIKKEKINYMKLLLSFVIAGLIFSLTYLVAFVKQGFLFNIFAYQARVLKFMLSHNSAATLGGTLILFLAGSFKSWWGRGIIKSDLWTILWPAGLISGIYLAIKTKMRDIKFFFYLLPLAYLVLTFSQDPFARYFIIILPFVYLGLSKIIVDLISRKF